MFETSNRTRLATVRYDAGRRVKGSLVLAGGLSLYAAFLVWYYGQLDGIDIDEMVESMPPAMVEAFGIETMATMDGFMAAQFYNFVWLLGLGLYFAYVGGGVIAKDVEGARMDVFLSLPLTRSRLLLEKVSSLFVPLFVLNLAAGAAVYLSVNVGGHAIDPWHLSLVHLLSIPYLFVCASIGLVLSVAVNRADIAQRAAIALVFALYLIETLVASSDAIDGIKYLSPTGYFEPTSVLIDGSVQLVDVGMLLVVGAILLVIAAAIFELRDL